ncbi:uncharacterized protein LOC107459445 [Arachis duranensis]|uniref:Uncharacterized protein LOC107459445 n=1 Tax=Arachis duranensis TaxID=130453 RepID=A0A6P4B6X3_ARADU|nr:uncharacterized protein LOC107459445 [Arachis duranensis]
MEKNQAAAIHTQPSPQGELDIEKGVIWEEANYFGNSSRQVHDPYSKTYNPGWRNHPNFGWENQQNQGQNHKPHNSNQYTYQQSNPRSYQHPYNNSSQPPYQTQNNHSQQPNSNQPSPHDDDRMSKIKAMFANLCKESQEMKNFKEEVRAKKNPRGETKKIKWEECKVINLSSEEVLEEDTSKPTEHSRGISQGNLEEKEQRNGHVQGNEPKRREILKPYVPKAPIPQRLRGGEKEKSYSRFLDMFASLNVNIPFIKTLQQMPTYIKCMNELLTKKGTLKVGQTMIMNKECSALIKKDLPLKKKDLGSFHIPCAIGDTRIDRGFCDLGASINVMPLPLMKRLQINELKSTDVVIQLADKTQKQAEGVVENVLVKVGNYFLSTDFVVLDMEESHLHPIILGRPFLATARALIDVQQGELILRIYDEHLIFHVFKPTPKSEPEPKELKDDHSKVCLEESNSEPETGPLKQSLVNKQEFQGIQQPRESKEELKPQESGRAVNKDFPNTRVNGALMEKEKRVLKKLPRGWRNKKIPT